MGYDFGGGGTPQDLDLEGDDGIVKAKALDSNSEAYKNADSGGGGGSNFWANENKFMEGVQANQQKDKDKDKSKGANNDQYYQSVINKILDNYNQRPQALPPPQQLPQQQIPNQAPMGQPVAYNSGLGQPQQQPSLLMQQASANPQLSYDLAQRAQNVAAGQKVQTIVSPLGLGSIHIIGKEHENELPDQAETTVRPDKGYGKVIMVKRGEDEA